MNPSTLIRLKTPEEIARIRRAGAVVAEVLRRVRRWLKPGISTAELDARIEALIRERGGTPVFKGYHGYPAASCISINEEVVHGIPRKDRRIRKGDLVKVDVGVRLDGYIADGAWTFAVGKVSPVARKLMEVTRKALEAGIQAAREGNRVVDISHAVEQVIRSHGFYPIVELQGHGVGVELHEKPDVPNLGRAGTGVLLRKGMVIAIEPMVSVGTEHVFFARDGWTAITVDRSLAAHYEHTVAVGPEGGVILTRPLEKNGTDQEESDDG